MKRTTSFMTALLAATLLAGVASAKTLVYCSEGSPEGFDPGLYTAGTTFDASSRPVYNRLVEFKPGTTEIEPGLAESWEISDDGLVYTFHLRDAKFSDGSPVTAQDAVFSLTRVRDDPESVQSAIYQIIKSVEAPDDRTVVITLSEPSAPFLATLAMFAAAVLPEHAVTELGEQFSEQPVGAGAFRLAEWRRGEPEPCGDGLEAEADAAVVALESAYPPERLRELARTGGRDATGEA